MATAKYTNKSVCECGYTFMKEDVPLGKVYKVVPESITKLTFMCGQCYGIQYDIDCILASEEGGTLGYLPLAIFETEKS